MYGFKNRIPRRGEIFPGLDRAELTEDGPGVIPTVEANPFHVREVYQKAGFPRQVA
jgi:hypothetical protein